MKEELEGVMNALVDGIQKESEEKHGDYVQEILKEYHYLDVKNPEHFNLLLSQTTEQQEELLVAVATDHIELAPKEKEKYEFVYLHYDFIERHLETIVLDIEGLACSADKTRWLIDTYLQYMVTGEVPTVEKRNYWHPFNLNIEAWMKWIDSMYQLYYHSDISSYCQSKVKVLEGYHKKEEE